MDIGLRGKTAVITGGSSGIGRGIARALAREGVDIAMASRNPEPDAVEEVSGLGVRALALSVDVSVENQVVDMVQHVIDAFEHLTGTDVLVDGGLHLRPLPLYTDAHLVQMNVAEEPYRDH